MRRNFKTRRGVLTLTGGALAGLAGCIEGESDDSGSNDVSDSSSDDDDSDSGSVDESEPIETPAETPTEADTVEYNQSFTETANVPGGSYIGTSVGFENEFTLEWRVVNELDSSADFDVFLFSESEFQIYDAMIEGESRRPKYYTEGSVQGIEESASRTITLSGGNYALVVDNSDYGDAGDFGTEDTRRVTLTAETREA